jgi:hypothetical protein
MFAGVGSGSDDLGMGIRRRADHDGIQGMVIQQSAVVRDRRRHVEFAGTRTGGRCVHIGDRDEPSSSETTNDIPSMNATDTSGSYQPER